jgi:hypothetical protein
MGVHECLISVLGWKIPLETLQKARNSNSATLPSKVFDFLQEDEDLPEYDHVLATLQGFEFTLYITHGSYMTDEVFSYFGVNYSDGTEATIPVDHILKFNNLQYDFPEEFSDIRNCIVNIFGSYVAPSVHSLAFMS